MNIAISAVGHTGNTGEHVVTGNVMTIRAVGHTSTYYTKDETRPSSIRRTLEQAAKNEENQIKTGQDTRKTLHSGVWTNVSSSRKQLILL